ncbi:substrate-binding domain-containing protein [Pseudonocardia endophytica]|uniref:ABC-type branched-subunit amino acid transport system substrate-binding protein n=1 Tax=Pseudonocardia endophytica TaxID=401976 RepID=A0A4R1I467_PSEEN|nr:substrate-binding domain-containing protein [Pseudonocardia endophytica]TCK24812.1 ABC-type branched-subunit amino acid transport system substrate-binding protein [Pseudonocardia endophytica]
MSVPNALLQGCRSGDINIALVVPQSGPSGIYGPSCEASARLAVSEINNGGGILGREVQLHLVDGGAPPRQVASEVDRMVRAGDVTGIAGWHTSAVREEIAARVAGRVPYLYTAVYEGGEHAPGVFLTGETPVTQLLPAMRWMSTEMGVRRWFVLGSDYVWPRESARSAREFADQVDAEIADEVFVELGTEDFGGVLRRIEHARPHGVLMFLLGSDAVRFNRAFTEMCLHERCVRLSPLMDENMLFATGAANTHELYSAAGFFETLGDAYSLDYGRRYQAHLGQSAPAITSPGESCYEGITLLERLAAAAGSMEVGSLVRASESLTYEGPRGAVRVQDRHLQQRIYMARADGLEFDVLHEINSGI